MSPDRAVSTPTLSQKWSTKLQSSSSKRNHTAVSGETRSEWLGPLLVAARAGAAVGESSPVPYVKGAFAIVVLILETVQKMKKNQDSLKELCDNTVKLMDIIQHQILSRQGMPVNKLMGLCQEFENLMKDVMKKIEQIQGRDEGTRSKVREFFKSDTIMEQINGLEKKIQTFLNHIQLVASLDNNFQLHMIAASSILPASTAVQVNGYINNCPLPSRIFHGRQAILDKMQQYFSQDSDQQQLIYVLHGLGGAGKTQIALKFIQLSRSCFSSIYFVDTSSVETINTSFKFIAISKKIGDTAESARQWLTSKQEQWLLFFDNANDPKIDLNKFIPQCSHGNIIITSQNPALCVYSGSNSSVSGMEEDEAIQLLLKSAAQNITPQSRMYADAIVKELAYFPLAIIQAGAFIAKSQNLEGYLVLYAANKTRLLSEKPAQSHDSHALTVYTTWQISFEQLSPLASQFLQHCSFLHYGGISEEIFMNASRYHIHCALAITENLQYAVDQLASVAIHSEQLNPAFQFLAQFKGSDDSWDSLQFQDIVNETLTYSLMNFDPMTKLFSMHPLVHYWCHAMVREQESYRSCMVGIIGMYITSIPEEDFQLASMRLLPHLDVLVARGMQIIPDFGLQYARVYHFAGNYHKALSLGGPYVQKLRDSLGDHHPDTFTAMSWLASIYINLGQYAEAQKLEVIVLEKSRELFGEHHPEALRALANLAAACFHLGQFQETKKLQLEVLEKSEKLLGESHTDTLRALHNLSITYQSLGQFKEAMKLQTHVLDKHRIHLGNDHPDTLTTIADLALVYRHLGQHEEAKKLDIEVLQKRKKLLGDNHPNTLRTMASLAVTHWHLNELEEAEQFQLDVLEKRQNLLGDDHPDTLGVMGNLARTYQSLGRLEDAKKLQVDVLTKCTKFLGDNHPDTLAIMGNLAVTYRHLGQLEETEKLQVDVLEKCRKLLGDDHPDTLTEMSNLALTYKAMGQREKAEELQVDVLVKSRKVLGDDHPDTFLAAVENLALTYKSLGQLEVAKKLEMYSLAKCRQVLGDDHPNTLNAMVVLATTFEDLGQFQEAEKFQANVVEKCSKSRGDDHRLTFIAMIRLAATYRNLGKFEQAKETETYVLEKFRILLGTDHPDTLAVMSNLAETCQNLGQFEEVKGLKIDLLAIRKKLLGDDHPDTLGAKAILALTYKDLGQFAEAKQLQVDVLEKRRKCFGDNHPDTLMAMANLAITYQHLAQLEDAKKLQIDVVTNFKLLHGDDHPYTLTATGNLALTCQKLGQFEEAKKLQLDVLKKRRMTIGDDDPSTLIAISNLAFTCQNLGQFEDAKKLQLEIYQKRRNLLGDDHPHTVSAAINLADTIKYLGDIEEAEELGKVVSMISSLSTQ
ncbi:hypothetical protein DFH08DRAFT_779415 [Mycena albidolilacea]|uniref:TPR-like protein n=1 Tax=Mycena albidolilacea TaxID=1033008 RepID=A0AAD7EST9_9AGAR|nr:hypothetical protein DFH08DRAFT_779415 [Mycena albidolilacea]